MNKEKLIHQLFVGKVADIIGFERTTQLLKDSKDVFEVVSEGDKFSIDNVSDCDHNYIMIGHQLNGHYECTKCKHQKDL